MSSNKDVEAVRVRRGPWRDDDDADENMTPKGRSTSGTRPENQKGFEALSNCPTQ